MGKRFNISNMVEKASKRYAHSLYLGKVQRLRKEIDHLGHNVILHKNFNFQFPENISLCENSWIGRNAFLIAKGSKIKIGRKSVLAENICMITANHNFISNELAPYDEKWVTKDIIVGDYVWMGFNCNIVPGVTIGDGAVIGMGSVVTKDIPKYAIAGGNPARVIKYRDVDKFERVKKKCDEMSSNELFQKWLESIPNKELQLKHKIS